MSGETAGSGAARAAAAAADSPDRRLAAVRQWQQQQLARQQHAIGEDGMYADDDASFDVAAADAAAVGVVEYSPRRHDSADVGYDEAMAQEADYAIDTPMHTQGAHMPPTIMRIHSPRGGIYTPRSAAVAAAAVAGGVKVNGVLVHSEQRASTEVNGGAPARPRSRASSRPRTPDPHGSAAGPVAASSSSGLRCGLTGVYLCLMGAQLCWSGFHIFAKCWGAGTKLMMFDGRTKAVQDIVRDRKRGIPQLLMGDDSTPRNVSPHGLVDGLVEPLYRVSITNTHGPKTATWTCNGKHILVLRTNQGPAISRKGGGEAWEVRFWAVARTGAPAFTILTLPEADAQRVYSERAASWKSSGETLHITCTVADYLSLPPLQRSHLFMIKPDVMQFPLPQSGFAARVEEAIRLRGKSGLVINHALVLQTAWVVGVWLSAGRADRQLLMDLDRVVNPSRSRAQVILALERWRQLVAGVGVTSRITGDGRSRGVHMDPVLSHIVHSYGMLKFEFMSHDLLTDSVEVRRALLAGIMDGNGYLDTHEVHTVTVQHEAVAKGLEFLAESLGIRSGYVHNSSSVNAVSEYLVRFSGHHLVDLPLVLASKSRFDRHRHCADRCYPFTIHREGSGPVYGFALDGNRQCVMDDFIVTHNTAFDYMPPMVLPWLRAMLTAPILFIICYWQDRNFWRVSRNDLFRMALLGTILCAGCQNFFNLGLMLTSAADGGISQPAIPVFASMMAILTKRESPTWLKMIGILCGIAGTVCIVIGETYLVPTVDAQSVFATDGSASAQVAANREVNPARRLAGIGCFLIQCFLFAIYMFVQKPLLQRIPTWTMTFYTFLFGIFPTACVSIYFCTQMDWTSLPPVWFAAIAYTVAFASIVGFIMFSYATKHLPTSVSAMGVTFQPFFSSILGAIFLHEVITYMHFIGGMFLIAGLGIVITSRNREAKNAQAQAELELAAQLHAPVSQVHEAVEAAVHSPLSCEDEPSLEIGGVVSHPHSHLLDLPQAEHASGWITPGSTRASFDGIVSEGGVDEETIAAAVVAAVARRDAEAAMGEDEDDVAEERADVASDEPLAPFFQISLHRHADTHPKRIGPSPEDAPAQDTAAAPSSYPSSGTTLSPTVPLLRPSAHKSISPPAPRSSPPPPGTLQLPADLNHNPAQIGVPDWAATGSSSRRISDLHHPPTMSVAQQLRNKVAAAMNVRQQPQATVPTRSKRSSHPRLGPAEDDPFQ